MRRLLLLAAGMLAVGAPAAGAATIDVTTTDDAMGVDSRCSLREAISSANADAAPFTGAGECAPGSGADTVTLPPGTFKRVIAGGGEDANAAGDLDVTSAMTIAGSGAASTIIDADGKDRVLHVLTGATLTLTGVTITGGHAPDGGGAPAPVTGGNGGPGQAGGFGAGGNGPSGEPGGGIRVAGALVVRDSTVSGNRAGDGGPGGTGTGGFGDGSTAGSAGGRGFGGTGGFGGHGGAIYSIGSVTLTRVLVTGNTAGSGATGGTGSGGQGGFATGSSGVGGTGGRGDGGSGGHGGSGGGVYIFIGSLAIDQSSFRGNTAGQAGAGGTGQGAAGGLTTASSGAGSGGIGGEGIGGFGGSPGEGGAIVMGSNDPFVLSRTLFASNVAGAGGRGGNGAGGPGGESVGSPSPGGRGGDGTGGRGSSGGEASAVQGQLTTYVNDTITANTTGAGATGGTGTGGAGGPVSGAATSGSGGTGTGGAGGNGGNGGLVAFAATEITHSTITSNGTGSAAGGGSGNPGPAGAFGTFGTPGSAGGAVNGAGGSAGNPSAIHAVLAVTMRNTIVASNSSPACRNPVTDGGHNISFADPSCPGADVAPLLGALADNGGPTQTIRPDPGSPAIDAVPASGSGCATVDQRGLTRPFGAGCDIGAYERAMPVALITQAGPSAAGTVNPSAQATTAHFEYGTTTAYGSSTPDIGVPAGLEAVAVSAELAGLAPSATYHVRLVASNPDGTASSDDASFTTSAQGGGGADVVAPVIQSASVKPKTFHRRRGTTFRYKLSEAAKVVFTIQRKKGKRYVKATRFSKSSKAGANTRKFRTRRLKPGRYRATLVATDTAGNRSKAKRLSFRIKR